MYFLPDVTMWDINLKESCLRRQKQGKRKECS